MQNANIASLKLCLRETENIRFGRQRRAQEMQHAQKHSISPKSHSWDSTTRTATTSATISTTTQSRSPFIYDILEETHADAD